MFVWHQSFPGRTSLRRVSFETPFVFISFFQCQYKQCYNRDTTVHHLNFHALNAFVNSCVSVLLAEATEITVLIQAFIQKYNNYKILFCSQYCCNLSGGVALIVWFTTNGMCAKNKNICMWREQAIIEWSWHVNSIVACCHSAKLCAYDARDFRSQQ